MSLNDMGNNGGGYAMTMPVAPLFGGGYPAAGGYGGGGGLGGFGGDYAWLLLFMILLGGGMWGGMGGFGMGMGGMMWPMMLGGMGGGFGLDYLYPWLNNSQHISDGFRDQQLNSQIGDLRSDVNRGFGDVQLGISGLGRQICETGNGIVQAVNNGFSSAEIAANGRQMANMQTQFGIQSAIQGGAATTAAGIADLKYSGAREACDSRAVVTNALQTLTMQNVNNTNGIVTVLRDGIQGIKDEICADRLALERRAREEDQREIAQLRSELMYARGQASQVAQTSQIVDDIYNRLSTCPVNTVSVYGNQPVYRCAGPVFGNGNGCGYNGAVA